MNFSRQRLWLSLMLSACIAACAVAPANDRVALAEPVSASFVQPAYIVAKYFAPPPVRIATPAFSHRDRFTSQSELVAFTQQLSRKTDRLHLRTLTRSTMGHDIPMLVFTTANDASPHAVKATGKPTVWVHAQQHGDEPAAGEGALALALALTQSLGRLLDRINVIIVPRVNPDGAIRHTRQTIGRFDLNRDSMRMLQIESRALRQTNLEYSPVVTIDAHEYDPARRKLKRLGKAGYIEANDMMILGALNPNIPRPLREFTDKVLVASAMAALRKNGLTVARYYQALKRRNGPMLRVRSGGVASRIGRNFHGLTMQASILLESRGIGLGRASFKRRVYSHLSAMQAILETVYEDSAKVMSIVSQAAAQTIAQGERGDKSRDLLVVTSQPRWRRDVLPFIDLSTGDRVLEPVDYFDYANPSPKILRRRPYAYVLLPEQRLAAQTLTDIGLQLSRLESAQLVEVEAMTVIDAVGYKKIYEGAMRVNLTVRANKKLVHLPRGSYVIRMNQPLANLAAESLEPEGADSLFRFGVLPSRKGQVLPVYRVLGPTIL